MGAYFKSALSITVPATSRPKEGRLLALMCPFAKAAAKKRAAPIAAVLPVRSSPPTQSRRPPRDMAASAFATFKLVGRQAVCARSNVAEPSSLPGFHPKSCPRSVLAAHALRRHWRLEENREQRGNEQRHPDAGDAGLPAEPVEELAEDRGAHEAAKEIEGEIESACRAAVRASGSADKAGGGGLREEGADADKHHARQEGGKA